MIAKDNWYTPQLIADKVKKFYPNGFLDPASCKEANKVMGATRFYSDGTTPRDTNGLSLPWDHSSIWLNPPYSQPLLDKFISRLFATRGTGWVEALVLVNSSTGSKWFHRLASQADARLDVKGRIKFWKPETAEQSRLPSDNLLFTFGTPLADKPKKKPADSPRFDNVLFYFGGLGILDTCRVDEFSQIFGDLGLVYGRPYRDH